MKTVYLTLIFAFLLLAGCREPGRNETIMETAVISCEAAHVTMETTTSGTVEESDGND